MYMALARYWVAGVRYNITDTRYWVKGVRYNVHGQVLGNRCKVTRYWAPCIRCSHKRSSWYLQ